jgi:hypothetical protein
MIILRTLIRLRTVLVLGLFVLVVSHNFARYSDSDFRKENPENDPLENVFRFVGRTPSEATESASWILI